MVIQLLKRIHSSIIKFKYWWKWKYRLWFRFN